MVRPRLDNQKPYHRGGYRAAADYLKAQGLNEKIRLVEISDPEAKNLDEAFHNMWVVANCTRATMHGKIYGLGLGVTSVLFEPQTSKDGKSYFRLIADPANEAYEIGAAFPKEKDGKIYHSISIDSPVLPAPINAALFPDKESGALNLVWNRQDSAKDLKAEATVNVSVQPQQTQTRRSTGPQPTL